eukprot:COSAG05_NODE_685_length_7933_cov_622.457110_4_plen_106_part_00
MGRAERTAAAIVSTASGDRGEDIPPPNPRDAGADCGRPAPALALLLLASTDEAASAAASCIASSAVSGDAVVVGSWGSCSSRMPHMYLRVYAHRGTIKRLCPCMH